MHKIFRTNSVMKTHIQEEYGVSLFISIMCINMWFEFFKKDIVGVLSVLVILCVPLKPIPHLPVPALRPGGWPLFSPRPLCPPASGWFWARGRKWRGDWNMEKRDVTRVTCPGLAAVMKDFSILRPQILSRSPFYPSTSWSLQTYTGKQLPLLLTPQVPNIPSLFL